MDEKKKEIRTLECKLSIRETAPDAQSESRTIVGTAIVFDVESEVLDDWGTKFREIIRPEACTMEFLSTQDIKMNMLHDRNLTVARWNKGVGPLRLSVDEKGVHFEFEAPRCDLGDRALELVRTGVYSGCSFEFFPEEYEIRELGSDVEIVHTKFRAISALTLGMDPAYKQTTVNAREMWRETEAGKREEEEQQAIMKREREKSAALRRMRERDMEEWDY